MSRLVRKVRGHALPLVAVAFATACPGPSPEANTASAAAAPGIYQLQRVNGSELATGDGQHLFVNGVLDLGADGTWCMGIDWRGQLWSRWSADKGTYEESNESMSFTSPEGENARFEGAAGADGRVTVSYMFGGVSDKFTFGMPTDSLTPHCDR